MTPIIDIVFLLIIFFMLVCQFIVAENFMVSVPESIVSANSEEDNADKTTTVTVMFDEFENVRYAVGAEIIGAGAEWEIADAIAFEIDRQLHNLPAERRVICLRVDKDVCYRDSQYAIAGISASTATDIKLAAIREKVSR